MAQSFLSVATWLLAAGVIGAVEVALLLLPAALKLAGRKRSIVDGMVTIAALPRTVLARRVTLMSAVDSEPAPVRPRRR